MLGPSGFFQPNESGNINSDTQNLSLIYSSEDGFSELYRGCKNGRFFVYKALKKEFRGNIFYEELLKKDFNIGFTLNHACICQYFGMIDHPAIGNCIIMEWIDGRTLEELIDKGKVSRQIAKKIICEICDALEYIHHKQVIHRDLKPENIMITSNGDNVKIIDFGLADADSYNILKHPGGTRIYASPELLAGETIDTRSDIWSLGLIIKELTNRYNHISAKCLRRDKEQRYHSASEVKKAVTKAWFRKARILGIIMCAFTIAAAAALAYMASHKAGADDTSQSEPTATDIIQESPQDEASTVEDTTITTKPELKPKQEKTPRVPQHNSGESLDASDLDTMLDNAAKLIL